MIKVTDKLFIDADENCYIVKKYLGDSKKDGTPIYAALTYHSYLHEALGGILNRLERSVVNENDMTLTETLEKFKTLHDDITGLLKGVHEVEVVNDD